ncbi:lysophospholipid acyltransferase family protein [Hydrogenophilus hirschii]
MTEYHNKILGQKEPRLTKRVRTVLLRSLRWVLSRLSLTGAQRLGRMMGWVWWLASARYRRDLAETLAYAGFAARALRRRVIGETGVQVVEALWLWLQPYAQVVSLVRSVEGWEAVRAARTGGKGILFLTPHLGCFEITSLWVAQAMPLTVLYRPPRQPELVPWLRAGRARGGVQLAPADRSGVRQLVAALHRGEAVGLLPDQTPKAGEGVWAPFFGRPVWTMTLAARLSLMRDVVTVVVWGERLPNGAGFRLHFAPVAWSGDEAVATRAAQINRVLETWIRRAPEQYLWGYPRFKVPAGVAPPVETAHG